MTFTDFRAQRHRGHIVTVYRNELLKVTQLVVWDTITNNIIH